MPSSDEASHVRRVLNVVSLIAFATALFTRAVDPIVPPIARDLAVPPATVALLSTAFALPFALIQPLLGPIADMVGKTRIMLLCLSVLLVAATIAAVATSFPALLVTRIVAGMAAGGIFPVAVAIIGDLVAVAQRQVALGRYMAIVVSGNLLGTSLSGVVNDIAGWRSVFVVCAVCGAVAWIAAVIGLRGVKNDGPARLDLKSIPASYRAIFANPRAKVCFGAVFVEGVAIFGLFPYMALLLIARGEPRAAIAGAVLAGFALGGIAYALLVRILLGRLAPGRLMMLGGGIAAVALLAVAPTLPWPVELGVLAVMGFGFYMLHNCIQLQATEIAPTGRGAATALHSSAFFLGTAVGPVAYGFGLAHLGAAPTLAAGAVGMALTGWACARLFRDREPPA
ncbi:MAG: MFS transporter [Xanthobacteraceae bacterium]|jgi:predicted MFS family arabinose efflux permease